MATKLGRPAGTYKYKSANDLPEGWRSTILSMMAEGASETEVTAALIGKNYQVWRRLQEQDAEFRRVVQFGRILAQAWWERMGRENLTARYFQTGLWSMNMKNRFGWSDQTTIKHDIGDNLYEKYREINTTKLKERARELLRKYGTKGVNPSFARIDVSEEPKSS